MSGGPSYKKYHHEYLAQHRSAGPISDEQIWKAVRGRGELHKYGYIAESISWLYGIGIVAKTHAVPQPWNMTEVDGIRDKLMPFPAGTERRRCC